VSPRSEETLSIVVSKGSKDSSQNNGSSIVTQLQIVSPRRNTTQNMMAGVDPTLRMLVFHGQVQKIQNNICSFVRQYGL
jgi:hypothetical protein